MTGMCRCLRDLVDRTPAFVLRYCKIRQRGSEASALSTATICFVWCVGLQLQRFTMHDGLLLSADGECNEHDLDTTYF